MSITRKQLIITALVATVFFLGLATGINMLRGEEFNEPAPQLPTVTRQDPEVVAIMKELMLSYEGLNLYYEPNPTLPDTIATFTGPNTIHIRPDVDMDIVAEVAMHEYMHYVQITDTVTAKSFYPYVTELYNSNKKLYDRMTPYREKCEQGKATCDFTDEIEAVACTETDYRILREDFDDWCSDHLPMKYILFPY